MPTYPLALPTTTGVQSIAWEKTAIVGASVGRYHPKLKVHDWGGKRWEATVRLPVLLPTQWPIWEAFFLSLNGLVGTFWLGPTLDKTARGVATGTPVINGGSQTGQTIVSDGWTPSTNNILKAGDWLQIGNSLYRTLADANSDGSGNCTFEVWPNLRTSPDDNAAITLTNPKGLFRLLEMPPLTLGQDHLAQAITFKAVERL